MHCRFTPNINLMLPYLNFETSHSVINLCLYRTFRQRTNNLPMVVALYHIHNTTALQQSIEPATFQLRVCSTQPCAVHWHAVRPRIANISRCPKDRWISSQHFDRVRSAVARAKSTSWIYNSKSIVMWLPYSFHALTGSAPPEM